MDYWTVLFLFIILATFQGWWVGLFNSAILYFCGWRDGDDINWGWETFTFLAVPFAWMFAILEIMMLYSK